jgi:hypothetical protein
VDGLLRMALMAAPQPAVKLTESTLDKYWRSDSTPSLMLFKRRSVAYGAGRMMERIDGGGAACSRSRPAES